MLMAKLELLSVTFACAAKKKNEYSLFSRQIHKQILKIQTGTTERQTLQEILRLFLLVSSMYTLCEMEMK